MGLTKAFGWLLLILGLAIIFYGLYSSWQIFSAKAEAPLIFVASPAKPVSSGKTQSLLGGLVGLDFEKLLSNEVREILPDISTLLPRLLNLVSWSIFSGILFFGGSQIASLGIKLLK